PDHAERSGRVVGHAALARLGLTVLVPSLLDQGQLGAEVCHGCLLGCSVSVLALNSLQASHSPCNLDSASAAAWEAAVAAWSDRPCSTLAGASSPRSLATRSEIPVATRSALSRPVMSMIGRPSSSTIIRPLL